MPKVSLVLKYEDDRVFAELNPDEFYKILDEEFSKDLSLEKAWGRTIMRLKEKTRTM